jgi:hypothetical protein
VFTESDTWVGGDFELALEIEARSDVLLSSALSALWQHPDLEGCYERRDREPADQVRVRPTSIEPGSGLLGIARLSNGKRVACQSIILRDEEADWLVLGIPMGSLGTVYRVGAYPFGSEGEHTGPWLREVESFLVGIAHHVARASPFRLGLVGHEVACDTDAQRVAAHGIPADRHYGYLMPLGATLAYHAITH